MTTFKTELQQLSLDADGGITVEMAGDATKITPESVESITVEDDDSVVLIRYSGGIKEPYFASTNADAAKVAAAVAEHLKLGDPARIQQTVTDAIILPGTLFVMALLASILLSVAAFSGGGEDGNAIGRAAALKQLVESLGPTGVLVLGGALTLATFGYLCFKLIARCFKTVYSKS